jgi:carboxymethylenebutenolidase
VVIQEIFGVNKVMRDIADGLAAEGFLAVCPDLFWRIEPGVDITDQSKAEWDKAFALYNAFDVELGVKDIQATITRVRADAHCTGKVGAVGFCLGGLLAFLTATRTDADAAVGYYGVGIEGRLAEAEKLTRPLMLHIAEEDGFVPKEAQAMIRAALKDHPRVEIHGYPGRDHAFAREGGQHYDAGDARLANGRTLAFLRRTLG